MGLPNSISPKTHLQKCEIILTAVQALYSPYSPNINSGGVLSQLQQQLGWTVPSCDNQACVVASSLTHRFSTLWNWSIVMSSKTKIGNLENALIVDEQVGRLHITVKDVVVVEIAQAFE